MLQNGGISLRLKKFHIKYYRSIESITINMPENKPLVLFGPNNAGKTNILSAFDKALGERFPTYIEMLDSDYFFRDKNNPNIQFKCEFDEPIHINKHGECFDEICITYGCSLDENSNIIHSVSGNRLYLSQNDRSKCHAYFIDAERNIQNAFSYSSRYSILSRFSKHIHDALTSAKKDELKNAFELIKNSFTETDEFSRFFEYFKSTFKNSVKGFVHSLDIDFSAYDPNNYAKSLRILAREGAFVRSFEELGTGEQQVLLMAFVKAYMQVFTGENFILIIEEPEAHLHPLAQRWLKEYIMDICSSGVQVIISTHSPEFIDARYLDGLVRVYKDNGITKIIQLSPNELCQHCIACGVPESKANPENIIEYYNTRLFQDQLKGFFAEKILLVEGATEYFSLPIYFKKAEYNLAKEGIEIVNCRGKSAILLYYRLFTAYGYPCYCLFDADEKNEKANEEFGRLFGISDWYRKADDFICESKYAYFGKDFESYLRETEKDYSSFESTIRNEYGITSKPDIAKAVAHHYDFIPEFISKLVKSLSDLSIN